MSNPKNRSQVQTVMRVFTILDALQELGGARITELGDQTGLANSTIHRYLTTLYDLGYIVKEGDEYHVALRFLDLGEYARTKKDVYQLAKPKVEELAEATGERCQFIVEEHGKGIYVYVATGGNAVETDSRLGKQLDLHSTSVGKSILAHLSESRVYEIIDQWGLPAYTENTITNPDELLDELATVKERGYAFNREGNIAGLRSVGAPVFGANGEAVGGLSISGPTHRMKGDRYTQEIPDLILGAANEIELNLKYH